MIPLWEEYPGLPLRSMAWRMGHGETYWHEFDEWFACQPPEANRRYALEHPEPLGWDGFYERKGVTGA